MKKINEIEPKALMQYARNLEEINEIEEEIRASKRDLIILKDRNETIVNTGKLPVLNRDDIPF